MLQRAHEQGRTERWVGSKCSLKHEMLTAASRPEDKAAKKERLLAEASAREEGKEVRVELIAVI